MRKLILLAAIGAVSCKQQQQKSHARSVGVGESEWADDNDDAFPDKSSGHALNSNFFSMVAIGDSITAGFNTGSMFGLGRNRSWAVGSDKNVESLSKFFRTGLPGKKTAELNRSISGSVVESLGRQISSVKSKEVDLFTILIGANDVCGDLLKTDAGVTQFKAKFEEALKKINAQHSEAKVIVAAIPSFKDVYNVGVAKGCDKNQWSDKNRFRGKIVQRFCPDLYGKTSSDTTRTQIYDRWQKANDGLKEVVSRHPTFATFVEATAASGVFTPAHLSDHDCFHPSAAGQVLLAKTVWDNGASQLVPSFQ